MTAPLDDDTQGAITDLHLAAADAYSRRLDPGAEHGLEAPRDGLRPYPIWLTHLAEYALCLMEEGQEAVRQSVPADLHDAFAMIMTARASRPDSPANERRRREEQLGHPAPTPRRTSGGGGRSTSTRGRRRGMPRTRG